MKSIWPTASAVKCLTTLRSCRLRSSVTCCAALLCLLASGYSQSNPGTYEVLHTFTGSPDGAFPAGLVRDTLGDLYGVAPSGGASGNGIVFKID